MEYRFGKAQELTTVDPGVITTGSLEDAAGLPGPQFPHWRNRTLPAAIGWWCGAGAIHAPLPFTTCPRWYRAEVSLSLQKAKEFIRPN